ncbi:hypothetical protein ACLOJK_029046 [Asimina triloba]
MLRIFRPTAHGLLPAVRFTTSISLLSNGGFLVPWSTLPLIAYAAHRLDVAARSDGRYYHRRRFQTTWQPFQDLGSGRCSLICHRWIFRSGRIKMLLIRGVVDFDLGESLIRGEAVSLLPIHVAEIYGDLSSSLLAARG